MTPQKYKGINICQQIEHYRTNGKILRNTQSTHIESWGNGLDVT